MTIELIIVRTIGISMVRTIKFWISHNILVNPEKKPTQDDNYCVVMLWMISKYNVMIHRIYL